MDDGLSVVGLEIPNGECTECMSRLCHVRTIFTVVQCYDNYGTLSKSQVRPSTRFSGQMQCLGQGRTVSVSYTHLDVYKRQLYSLL